MNSQIMTGMVSHGRTWPEKHHFSYPIYFYRFDLSELPELDRTVPGFGYNRFSIVRIDDKDYLWRGNQTLKDKISSAFEKIGINETFQRIELITFARYFNIIFRPVSFFLCYDEQNSCRMVLAEVHNTFRESHLYVLDRPDVTSESICFECPKAFHVSPFFDMNGMYKIRLKETGEHLDIMIALHKPECNGQPVFAARLTGQGRPLTASSLRRILIKYPFNAFLNLPRILRQAFTLYFRKKLTYYPKPIPLSPLVMRKQKPSRLARIGMHFCFSLFKKQDTGIITVILPEGERHSFGAAKDLPPATLQVNDYRFFSLLARAGEIGFGIAYEKGYWQSPDLVRLMDFLLCLTLARPVKTPWYASFMRAVYLACHLRNRNTLTGAKKNIIRHYDLSNRMYSLFLDKTMTYSCAIFDRHTDSLEDAQTRKIDRILDKACLCENHHLLEIGTGWGGLAIRAARRYGCRVTSITLSEEQQQLARERIKQAGLSDRIDVQICDYRNVTGQYDRIVSVEMLEAVGKAYFPAFFKSCDRILKQNGTIVIQTITIPDQRYEAYSRTTDWMRLFIFPGGLLPSLTILAHTLTKHTSLVIKDIESIGPHHALTLARWRERFLANRDKILQLDFPESFIRRWEYYFSYCQAGFARHYIDDLQIVITRPGNSECIEMFRQTMNQDKAQKELN